MYQIIKTDWVHFINDFGLNKEKLTKRVGLEPTTSRLTWQFPLCQYLCCQYLCLGCQSETNTTVNCRVSNPNYDTTWEGAARGYTCSQRQILLQGQSFKVV